MEQQNKYKNKECSRWNNALDCCEIDRKDYCPKNCIIYLVFEKNKEKNILQSVYERVKNKVIDAGYAHEIAWVQSIPEDINKELFFREYVWVVCNSGMKEQVARKIFDRFIEDYDFDQIRHPHKHKSVKKVFHRLNFYYDQYRRSKNKLKFLKSLPHIGDITKYHLARNLGLNYAKPDRHLKRIAALFDFKNVQKFCEKVSEFTKDEVKTIDLIFWRFANLNTDYIEQLKNLISEV
jgi:hypothetical protein